MPGLYGLNSNLSTNNFFNSPSSALLTKNLSSGLNKTNSTFLNNQKSEIILKETSLPETDQIIDKPSQSPKRDNSPQLTRLPSLKNST